MPNTPPNLTARGNISPCRFVKLDTATDFGALQAGANAKIIGISHDGGREAPIPSVSTIYAAIDGDSMRLFGDGDVCMLELGGNVSPGDYLKADSNGKGVVIASAGTTLQHIGAIALEGGSSGEKISVQVMIDSCSAGSNS